MLQMIRGLMLHMIRGLMLLFVILCTFCTVAWSQQSTVAFRNDHRGNETNHKRSSLTSGDIFIPLSFSSNRLSLLESSSSQATRVLTRREVSTNIQTHIVQRGPGGSSPALRDTRSATAHVSRGQPHYVHLKNNGFKPKPSPAQATFFKEQIKHLAPDVRTRLKEIYAQTGFTIGFQNLLKDTLKAAGQYSMVRIPTSRSNDLYSDSRSHGNRGNVKAGQSEHDANSTDSLMKATPMERTSRGDDTKTYRDRPQIAHSEGETSPSLDFTSGSSGREFQYSTSRANEPQYQMSRAGWRENPGVTKYIGSGNVSPTGAYLYQVSSGIPRSLHHDALPVQRRVVESRQRHVYATTPELHHRYYPKRPQMQLQLPASRVQYGPDLTGDTRARQHLLLRQRELWTQQQQQHQPHHPSQHPSQQPLQHPSQQPQQHLQHPRQLPQSQQQLQQQQQMQHPQQQFQHPQQLQHSQQQSQHPQQQFQHPQQLQNSQQQLQHPQQLQHSQQKLQHPQHQLQHPQQQLGQLQQTQLQQQRQLQQSQLQLQQSQQQLTHPHQQLQHPHQQLQPQLEFQQSQQQIRKQLPRQQQELQHPPQQLQQPHQQVHKLQQYLQQQQQQLLHLQQQQQQLQQPPRQHFQLPEPNILFSAQPTLKQQQRQGLRRQQQQEEQLQQQQQQRQLMQQPHQLQQQQRQRQQQLPYSGDHRTNSQPITLTIGNVQESHQTPDKTTHEAATLKQPNLKNPTSDNKNTIPLQQSIVRSGVSPLEHQPQAVAKFSLNTRLYTYRAEESGHAPQDSDVANITLAKSIQSPPNHYQNKDIRVLPSWQNVSQTMLSTLPSKKLIIDTSTLPQPTTTIITTTTATATTTMIILQPLLPSRPLQTPSTVAPPNNTTVVLSEHTSSSVILNLTHLEVIQKPQVTTEATKSTKSPNQVHLQLLLPSTEHHPSVHHNSKSSVPITTFSITSTARSPSLGTTSPEATVLPRTTPATRTTTNKVVPMYKPDVLLTPALFLTWSLPSSQVASLMGSALETVLSSINASRSQPGLTYNSKVEQFRTFLIHTLLEDPRSYTVTSEDIRGKKFHERTDEGPSIVVKILLPDFLNYTRMQTNTRQKRSSRVAILNINGGKHHVVALTSAVADNSKDVLELSNSPNLSLAPPLHNISRVRDSSKLSDLHDMNQRAKTIKATRRVNTEHERGRKKRMANFRNDPLVPVLRFIWLLPEGSFPPTPGETVDFIMKRFKRKSQLASSEYSTGNSTTYSDNSGNKIGNLTTYAGISDNKVSNSPTYSNNSINDIGNSTTYSDTTINKVSNSTTNSDNSNRSHHSTVTLASVASTISTNVSSHRETETNAGHKDTAMPNADVLITMVENLTKFKRMHGENANGIDKNATSHGSQKWTAPNLSFLDTLLRPQGLDKSVNTHSNIRIADGQVSKANNSDKTRQLLPKDAILALQSLAMNHSYIPTMPADDWLVSSVFAYFNQSHSSQQSRGFNTQPTGSGDSSHVTRNAMFKWMYDNIMRTRTAMTSGNTSGNIRMNTNESSAQNTDSNAASASVRNISPPFLLSLNLSSLTLRNTPRPSLPPLNALYPSLPSPNTSHPSLPPSITSRQSLLPPNTSHPSLPPLNTSHLSLPPVNTSHISLPPVNTSHISLTTHNTSHISLPPLNTSHPSLPSPNTLHPSLPHFIASSPSLPPPNTPAQTLPVFITRPPSLPPLYTSPPSLTPLHTSLPSLPPLPTSPPSLTPLNTSPPSLTHLNTSPATIPFSLPSPSPLVDFLTRKQKPEILQPSPTPTLTPYYDDKHILHPDTNVGESQGHQFSSSQTLLPHVSLLSRGLSSTPSLITPTVGAFLSSKNETTTPMHILNEKDKWETRVTTPAAPETSYVRLPNKTWNHTEQSNTFENLAELNSTPTIPVSSNTSSSKNYVSNAAPVDPSIELVLNHQPRTTNLLDVGNLTPLVGTTSAEGIHSTVINEAMAARYKPTHEHTSSVTTTHATPNISLAELTTPASANHLSTSSLLYFDTKNSSRRNPSIEQLNNVALIADILAPDSVFSMGNNSLSSNSDPSEFNSHFFSQGLDVTGKINLESGQHVHSKQIVAGSNTSSEANVGSLNAISLTEGAGLNNLTAIHQDAGKSGLDLSYFNSFMEVLWNVVEMMVDRKSAQNPAITTTTMKPQTTTPGLCPAGLAVMCVPAKASARLMSFCQQRCDLSTGFCSTALCVCVCGDETVAGYQPPQHRGMTGWGSWPATNSDLNLMESGNVFISGFDPEIAPASSPRPLTTTKVTLPGIPTVSDEHINSFLEFLAQRNEGRQQGHKNSNKESEAEW